jgi:hypothetical protein
VLTKETKNLSEINNLFAQQNIAFSKNNELFVKQLQEKTNEINKQVTGGDSYVLFDVSFTHYDSKIMLNIENIGDVKLDNVSIEIWDNERISTLDPNSKDRYIEMKKFITPRFFKVLYPKSPVEELDFKIDEKFDNINLSVDIKFGNRHLTQTIWVYNYKDLNTRRGEVKVIENNKVILHYTYTKNGEPIYLVK